MLKLDHFWEEEAGAPLLMHDKGFIREMGDEIWEVTGTSGSRERAYRSLDGWVDLMLFGCVTLRHCASELDKLGLVGTSPSPNATPACSTHSPPPPLFRTPHQNGVQPSGRVLPGLRSRCRSCRPMMRRRCRALCSATPSGPSSATSSASGAVTSCRSSRTSCVMGVCREKGCVCRRDRMD